MGTKPLVGLLFAALTLLTGCTAAGQAGSSQPPPAIPSASVTSGASSVPTSSATGAASTPTPATTTAERNRYIEVKAKLPGRSFASPSGRHYCSISAEGYAVCLTIAVDQKALRKVKCPDSGSGYWDKPNIVELGGTAALGCATDQPADPRRDPDAPEQTDWVEEAGGTWVTSEGGDVVAALPYGKALRAGSVICTSEEFGITCVNSKTGHGFLIRNRGVVTF